MKVLLSKYQNLLIFIGIVILHLIIKVIYIDQNPIAFDEPFSIYHSQLTPSQIINELTKGNNPPLYELILHFWIQLDGISAFWVRLPSVFFSALTAGMLFLLGKKNFNVRMAFIAVLLFTLSTYQFTYAHEARSYTLFSFLSILSMYFLLSWRKEGKKRFIIVTVVLNALLLYTHYLSVFIPVVQFLICLSQRKTLLKYLSFSLITLVLCSPLIGIIIERLSISSESGGTWVQPSSVKEIVYGPIYFLNHKLALIPLFAFFAAYVYFFCKKIKIFKNRNLFLWFGVPYFCMYLISLEPNPFHIPVFIDRYYFFTALPFYLICAWVIDRLLKQSIKIFIPLTLIWLGIITFYTNIHPTHDRKPNEVAELLKNKTAHKEAPIYILPDYANLNLMYHYRLDIFKTVPLSAFHQKLEEEKIYSIQSPVNLPISNEEQNYFYIVDMGYDEIKGGNNLWEYLNSLDGEVNTFKVDELYQIHSVALN